MHICFLFIYLARGISWEFLNGKRKALSSLKNLLIINRSLYISHPLILEWYNLQRLSLHYSWWWSNWSLIITILIEGFIVYPCSKVQKSLSILYSFPVIFSYKNLIVDLQFGYSKDILKNGKSIIHVLSFHSLPYYSN